MDLEKEIKDWIFEEDFYHPIVQVIEDRLDDFPYKPHSVVVVLGLELFEY